MSLFSNALRKTATTALVATMLVGTTALACTRLVYHGVDNQVLTARSMDWSVDVETNL